MRVHAHSRNTTSRSVAPNGNQVAVRRGTDFRSPVYAGYAPAFAFTLQKRLRRTCCVPLDILRDRAGAPKSGRLSLEASFPTLIFARRKLGDFGRSLADRIGLRHAPAHQADLCLARARKRNAARITHSSVTNAERAQGSVGIELNVLSAPLLVSLSIPRKTGRNSFTRMAKVKRAGEVLLMLSWRRWTNAGCRIMEAWGKEATHGVANAVLAGRWARIQALKCVLTDGTARKGSWGRR